MKSLRIILRQNSANYRREETITNKQTYPLPPFSTVIGALHNACGFQSYQPIDISIQGKFESMHKEMYVDYSFLNSLQDDRGILVKMKNPNFLSKAFDKVAVAEKQGSSFLKGKTIYVMNESLLKEYRDLKLLNEKIQHFKKQRVERVLLLSKKRKQTLAQKKKHADKKSERYIQLRNREAEIKQLEKKIKDKLATFEETHYAQPIAQFRTLITAPMFYEILNQVELVLHIRSDKQTLRAIEDNIYRLKSIGRSEDFVEVIDVQLVTLSTKIQGEVESNYSAYLDYELVREETILLGEKDGIPASGTTYYLNKDYEIVNNQRIFNKKKVVYTSSYVVDELGDNLFLDETSDQTYIVNFI